MSSNQLSTSARDCSDAKSATASHRIKSATIVGGFMDGMRLDFSEHFTSIIGGRGTGKSSTQETIRYGLDAMPDDARERKRIKSLIQHNLAGGRVQIEIETKDGLAYTISRAWGEKPVVLTAEGEPTEISLAGSGLFDADIYSQNDVENIADDAAAQLRLIDSFKSKPIARIDAKIQETLTALNENAVRTLPLRGKLASLSEDIHRLPAVEQRLKGFSKSVDDVSGEINREHALKSLRDREVQAAREIVKVFNHVLRGVESLKGQINDKALSLLAPDMCEGPSGTTIKAIAARVAGANHDVDELLSQTALQIRAAREDLTGRGVALSGEHKRLDLKFRAVIEKHQKAQEQAAERSQVERLKNRLLAKQREHEEANNQLRILRDQRHAMLASLAELRCQRHDLRQDVVRWINQQLAPTILVRLIQEDDREPYHRVIRKSFVEAGIGYRTVAKKIVRSIAPAELAEAIRGGDVGLLARQANLKAHHAQKVITTLRQSANVLFELDVLELGDKPLIQLKDGDEYKASNALSTGQKCTAILPILLLDSDRPLLIDQPEDNLDNGFVYETLLPIIHKVKTHRQLIFVTHNPNIPVLGDAERVFVFGSDGSHSHMLCAGTVDDCRDHIIALLEGGVEAFQRRKERYEC